MTDLPAPFPEYADKARRKWPRDLIPAAVDLLHERPELRGVGMADVVEAVACA